MLMEYFFQQSNMLVTILIINRSELTNESQSIIGL